MFENIKEKLKSILAEMATIKTVDGVEVEYEGDEIEVGTALKVEDGTYEFDDFTITVKDGVVTEKIEKETEEVEEEVEAEEEETTTTTEAPAEETTTTTEAPAEDDEVKKLREELDTLKATVEELKTKLEEIANTPAAEPIVEEFKAVEVNGLADALKQAKNLRRK